MELSNLNHFYQKLNHYADNGPQLMAQVDLNQYGALHAKYYHFLNKHEKDRQTINKLKEMNQNMQDIILSSKIVQQQLTSIGDIEDNKNKNMEKYKQLCEDIRRNQEEYESLHTKMLKKKELLIQKKRTNFQLRKLLQELNCPKKHSPTTKYKFIKQNTFEFPETLIKSTQIQKKLFQKKIGQILECFSIINKRLGASNQLMTSTLPNRLSTINKFRSPQKQNKPSLLQQTSLGSNLSLIKSDRQLSQKKLFRVKKKLIDFPQSYLLSNSKVITQQQLQNVQPIDQTNSKQLYYKIQQNPHKLEILRKLLNKQIKKLVILYQKQRTI